MKNIVFLGDSLTAGYGLPNPSSQAVPALIQHKIQQEGLDYKVHNAGLNGSTSGNGLFRLDHWLKRPIDVFVLELGINDFVRKIPVERTRYNLGMILQKVLAHHPQCKLVLLGMRLPKGALAPGADSFNSLYPELAEQFGLAFIPFFLDGVAGNKVLNLPDGLHPNAEGYHIIAEKIWPSILGVL